MTTLDSKIGRLLVRNGKLFNNCGCCDITDVPDPCDVSTPPFGLDEQGTLEIRYFPTDMTQEGGPGIQGTRGGSGSVVFSKDYRVNLELFPRLVVDYRLKIYELYDDISRWQNLAALFYLAHVRPTFSGLVVTNLTRRTPSQFLAGSIQDYFPVTRRADLIPFSGSFSISPIEELFPPSVSGRRWKMQRYFPDLTVLQPYPYEITQLTNNYDDVEIIDNCDSYFAIIVRFNYNWTWQSNQGIPNPGDPIRISGDFDYRFRVLY